ncbi:MAG: cyclohexa-1,5-dienecarbonyl-CoA hydratase [Rhodospirillales bacterium]|nr:cyclohexa-1,5-dienecarbonyl-CoA hydratase [Rhodospirillales bacterium]
MNASNPVKVWFERDGKLLRLRLDRPKANIVDSEMISALDGALAEHLENPAIHAVLLDSEGSHFCFGASVEEHLPEKCAAMLRAIHGLILRIAESPVPVLVAIRGQCLGGGLELALAAHLIFVAPDANLAQPEINIGVLAPAASCLLPGRVGRAAAEDLLISGRAISGDEACKIGLANFVAEDPQQAALNYFDTHLASKSSSSLRHAVRAARLGFGDSLRTQIMEVEDLYLNELMSSRDAVEGLVSFIEKRPARWENR